MPRVSYNDLTCMLMNMYDIRNALPPDVKSIPQHPDTDYTVGDLIDGVIETLESYDEGDE